MKITKRKQKIGPWLMLCATCNNKKIWIIINMLENAFIPWDGDCGSTLCSSFKELPMAFDTKFFKFGETFEGGIAKFPGSPEKKNFFKLQGIVLYKKKKKNNKFTRWRT